jgi:hypothetical protein
VAAGCAAPQAAQAAVQSAGCAGGSFADACGLDELVAGGSLVVGGVRFSNFVLGLNDGRLLDASAIRIDAIDDPAGKGFTLVDVGQTLRAANGDMTSSNFSFDITAVAAGGPLTGGSWHMAAGDITSGGSYANAFADLFDPAFTSYLGNMTAYCDGPACSSSNVSSTLGFADAMAISVVAGIDVASDGGGIAQINGLSIVMTTAVPEPGTWALLALGLAGLAWQRRARKPGVPG